MAGFFGLGLDLGTRKQSPASKRGSSLSGCDACGRAANCEHPKMGCIGAGERTRIMVVVEAPTKADSRRGELLSGESKRVLYKALRKAGVDIDHVWVVPAVRCGGTEPDAKHGECCRVFLQSDLHALNPAVVIPLGPLAIQSLIGDRIRGRLKGTRPTAWIGEQIPDQETGRWICPSFGIQYLMENLDSPDVQDMFDRDIRAAVACGKREFPKAPDETRSITDCTEAVSFLRYIKANVKRIAFDYETTGLKPHADGHRIVCASVAWVEDGVPVFPRSPVPTHVAGHPGRSKHQEGGPQQHLRGHLDLLPGHGSGSPAVLGRWLVW